MKCSDCHVEIDKFGSFNDRCGRCHGEHLQAKARALSVDEIRAQKAEVTVQETPKRTGRFRDPSGYRDILLTTETAVEFGIDCRVAIVSAEVVVGMNIFKDLFAGVRNLAGGRSNTLQNALKDIRIHALDALKREAFEVEADAVIGVTLNYQDIGATGSTMLMLVVTGTAVKTT